MSAFIYGNVNSTVNDIIQNRTNYYTPAEPNFFSIYGNDGRAISVVVDELISSLTTPFSSYPPSQYPTAAENKIKALVFFGLVDYFQDVVGPNEDRRNNNPEKVIFTLMALGETPQSLYNVFNASYNNMRPIWDATTPASEPRGLGNIKDAGVITSLIARTFPFAVDGINVPGSKSLQSMIETTYVQRANDLLYDKIQPLQDYLDATQNALSALADLVNMRNSATKIRPQGNFLSGYVKINITVPFGSQAGQREVYLKASDMWNGRNADFYTPVPGGYSPITFPGGNFGGFDYGSTTAGPDEAAKALSAYFNRPISLSAKWSYTTLGTSTALPSEVSNNFIGYASTLKAIYLNIKRAASDIATQATINNNNQPNNDNVLLNKLNKVRQDLSVALGGFATSGSSAAAYYSVPGAPAPTPLVIPTYPATTGNPITDSFALANYLLAVSAYDSALPAHNAARLAANLPPLHPISSQPVPPTAPSGNPFTNPTEWTDYTAAVGDYNTALAYYNQGITDYNNALANYNAQMQAQAASQSASIVAWLVDKNNDVAPGANIESGAIAREITEAITQGQNLNSSQVADIRSYMLLFEEYYKSAASILQQISQIITRMAQGISR